MNSPNLLHLFTLAYHRHRARKSDVRASAKRNRSFRLRLNCRANQIEQNLQHISHTCIRVQALSMDNSPLSKLPPELRNFIYELALHQDKPFNLHWSPTQSVREAAWSHSPKQALALTATCHRIRSECSKLFYATNTFVLDCPDVGLEFDPARYERVLVDFIELIGMQNAATTRSVVFNIRKHFIYDEKLYRDIPEAVDVLKSWMKKVVRLRLTVRNTILDWLLDDLALETACSAAIKQVDGWFATEDRAWGILAERTTVLKAQIEVVRSVGSALGGEE